MTIYNPHDRFFKKLMTEKRAVKEFFESNLPLLIKSSINFDSIQLQKDSFIDEELKLCEADALFSAEFNEKPGYIYLLVEHQSKPDKLMPFRMLKYMFSIMDMHLKKTNEPKLPVIYPMILYTGENNYNYSTDFFDLFGDNKQLAADIFWKPHQLIEISKIPDEKLRTQYEYGIAMLIMKHIHAKEDFTPLFKKIAQVIQLNEQSLTREYIYVSITYAFYASNIKSKEEFSDIIDSTITKVTKEDVMTLAEQCEQKGIEKGIEKGEANKAMAIAKKMLAKGLDLEEIAEITGLSLDQLSELETKH